MKKLVFVCHLFRTLQILSTHLLSELRLVNISSLVRHSVDATRKKFLIFHLFRTPHVLCTHLLFEKLVAHHSASC